MSNDKRDAITHKTILEFWFSEPANKKWFKSSSDFDQEIQAKYFPIWAQAMANQLDKWQESPESSLALVIVLDQFPLNMFRGTAKSFSTANKAISVSRKAISNEFDKVLSIRKLSFLYMPFMHSENLDDQIYSVKLFEQAGLESNIRFAKHHRSIIEKFNRFPHRNEILKRNSTPEELEYLASPQAFKD
jgi:uncharacterized protein (DUF924 family)